MEIHISSVPRAYLGSSLLVGSSRLELIKAGLAHSALRWQSTARCARRALLPGAPSALRRRASRGCCRRRCSRAPPPRRSGLRWDRSTWRTGSGGPLPACVGVPPPMAPAQAVPDAPTQHATTWAATVAAEPGAPCVDCSTYYDGRAVDPDAMAASRPRTKREAHRTAARRHAANVKGAKFDWIWRRQLLPMECLEPPCGATRVRPPPRRAAKRKGKASRSWSSGVCV